MQIRRFVNSENQKKVIVRYSRQIDFYGEKTTASKEHAIDDVGQTDKDLKPIYDCLKGIVCKQLEDGIYFIRDCPEGVIAKIKTFESLQLLVNEYVQYCVVNSLKRKGELFYDVINLSWRGLRLGNKLTRVTESELLQFIEQETAKLNLVDVE